MTQSGSGPGGAYSYASNATDTGHAASTGNTVQGTLSTIEVSLNALQIPHGKGGAQAAIDYLGQQVPA